MPNSLELNVSPALLHTFANHPFHVRKDMEMNELVDSIRESGVIVPLIVRSRPEGGYEIISGHRRCEACRELGIEKVPVRVQELTDDEATILMVNSNIQREHVLPSEKAFAYKMKMDAKSTVFCQAYSSVRFLEKQPCNLTTFTAVRPSSSRSIGFPRCCSQTRSSSRCPLMPRSCTVSCWTA
jgi:hypothetical protein